MHWRSMISGMKGRHHWIPKQIYLILSGQEMCWYPTDSIKDALGHSSVITKLLYLMRSFSYFYSSSCCFNPALWIKISNDFLFFLTSLSSNSAQPILPQTPPETHSQTQRSTHSHLPSYIKWRVSSPGRERERLMWHHCSWGLATVNLMRLKKYEIDRDWVYSAGEKHFSR